MSDDNLPAEDTRDDGQPAPVLTEAEREALLSAHRYGNETDLLNVAELAARRVAAERQEAWTVAAQRRDEARRYYVAWQVARMRAREHLARVAAAVDRARKDERERVLREDAQTTRAAAAVLGQLGATGDPHQFANRCATVALTAVTG